VALDGAGRNSPYSGPLIKAIGSPGEDILSILTTVRNDVLAATDDKQVPWENHALRARFYFNPGQKSQTSSQPQAPLNEVASAWTLIKDRKDIAILEGFRRQYGAGNPFYDTLASQRIEEIKREQRASLEARPPVFAPPAVVAPPSPPASSDFIFPDSDRRVLSSSELARLSKFQLRIARNEIYARRGRFFVSLDLQQHFGRFPWYRPYTKEPALSAIEQRNVTLIQQVENQR
jgi:YARHG domain